MNFNDSFDFDKITKIIKKNYNQPKLSTPFVMSKLLKKINKRNHLKNNIARIATSLDHYVIE